MAKHSHISNHRDYQTAIIIKGIVKDAAFVANIL
jgi:hypothetical protein